MDGFSRHAAQFVPAPDRGARERFGGNPRVHRPTGRGTTNLIYCCLT